MQIKTASSVFSLSLIMAIRMIGLFMILPIFSTAAAKLPFSTPFLVGAALGVYGLTQALCQAPLGILSDYIGRKPVITIGLIVFLIGSIVAALSANIYGILIGRALQGAGAIGSVILATVADITHEEDRTQAMAIIGLSIGMSFAIAFILGPLLNAWFHLQGIFWFCAGFALLGLGFLYTYVPNIQATFHKTIEVQPKQFKALFKNTELLRLNFGIFSLHTILTALFIGIPLLLIDKSPENQIIWYLVVLLLAFFIAIPWIRIAEKQRINKQVFIVSIVILAFTPLGLVWIHHSILMIGLLLLFFFSAFTFLEASLPSWITKIAPLTAKGSAMGIYSSCQFLGIFTGGIIGGLIHQFYGLDTLWIFCSGLGLIWLIIALSSKHPPYLSTVIFKVNNPDHNQLRHQISLLTGVSEVAILPQENLIYLKIDKKIINEHELRKLMEEGNVNQL